MRKINKELINSFSITATGSYLLLCLLTIKTGFTADLDCWIRWTDFVKNFGLPFIYGTDCNYMPLMPYVLYVFSFTQRNLQAITDHIFLLKYFVLLFDIAGAVLVSSLVRKKEHRIAAFLLIIFNIGYVYNTMIWGQVDTIHSTLLFISLYFVLRDNLKWSTLFFTLALLMKFIAVIYLPAFGILWMELWNRKKHYFPIAKIAVLNLGIIIISLTPFFYGMGVMHTVETLINSVVIHSNVISKSAFNFWEMTMEGPLFNRFDDEPLLGTTYKMWGTTLFLLSLGLALWPLIKTLKNKNKPPYQAICFLTFSMIAMLFFFFKTGIHERYIHPAIIFMAAYTIVTTDYRPYIILSLAYFLQLNNIMITSGYYTFAPWYIDKELVSMMFLTTIIYSYYRLYQLSSKKNYTEVLS